MKRKWEIEKLKDSKQFRKTANIILKTRIENLLDFTDKYFKNRTVEDLHAVRIALRRVRYSMELLLCVMIEKSFLNYITKFNHFRIIRVR